MNVILPIKGKIAAGSPIEPMYTEDILDLTSLLLGEDRFVLQVVGNSMSGDNICDGDYIICKRQHTAKTGDIVVVVVNNSETTLKRLQYNDNGSVTLLPSNPSIAALNFKREQIRIEGVYLGLIRLTESID